MRIPPEDLDYEADGLYYHEGALFTGTLTHASDDGDWIQVEEEYQDGLLSGCKREWHRPGLLALEAQCALGVRHGLCREWDEHGRLIAEVHYEYGIRVVVKRWDSAGNLVEEFRIKEGDPGFRILQASRNADPNAS